MVPLNILSLLGINKLWIYLACGILALGTITGVYYIWKSGVEQQALMEYNVRQLEQTIRDQEEFRRRQEALEQQQREMTRALTEQNRAVQTRVQAIQNNLNRPEMQRQDRPASDVLRQTVDELRAIR